MDMATEFPNTQFIGVDKTPLFPEAIRPPNASFRLLDVVEGLPFEDNSFDLINTRLFLLDLHPEFWSDFIKEVLRVTKPGGLFQMMEHQVIDEGDEVVQDFSTRVEEMMAKEGIDARVCDKLDVLLGESGFIPKQAMVKSIPLSKCVLCNPVYSFPCYIEGHVLSDEFMYVLDILFDMARWVAYAAYNISSETEYQIAKRRYMQSRRESSTTTWHYIVGQKPVS
ncbi:uncharacterized protein B0P05DRAFT_355117 [Gilbertella persicaria]|uniref:uncharacterized protein n=1 Tax=Gilbertella persicaria TaxID=101096 RepID=UPI00221F6682|nr:uncharacterized protein B0P05DRAFT_355117 [Gilbertella persicaria]KAI8088045.1 hypothetical protein B0P05DRAFT_355117 [Gilbertella persicaria]